MYKHKMSIPFFVVSLFLVDFVISVAATFGHDDQSSTYTLQSTLNHVDHLLDEKLTKTELLLRAVKRGNQRVQRLNSIQTTVDYDGSGEYLMKFSIGTPTPSPVTAIMDTGSSLIWTQCQPCEACFRQSTPVFDPKKSSSYSNFKCSTKQQCTNMLPSECSTNGYCNYTNSYGDGSNTRGVVATDTFTFEGAVQVPRIMFGCGVSNRVSFNTASGIVGLGPQGLSLVSQMNESRFSYCLPTIGSRKTGVLTLGSRATNPPGARVKSTSLIKNPLRTDYYYLSLQGITIGPKRLPINSSTFAIKKDGSGGMIIDCGTSITYLVKTAFVQVDKELTRQLGLNKSDWGFDTGFELCYDVPFSYYISNTTYKFPEMVFHFQNGVDLRLTHENYFSIDRSVGCLTMNSVGDAYFSVLGGFQQQNTLVVHDLTKGTLSFLPNYVKCSGN